MILPNQFQKCLISVLLIGHNIFSGQSVGQNFSGLDSEDFSIQKGDLFSFALNFRGVGKFKWLITWVNLYGPPTFDIKEKQSY